MMVQMTQSIGPVPLSAPLPTLGGIAEGFMTQIREISGKERFSTEQTRPVIGSRLTFVLRFV